MDDPDDSYEPRNREKAREAKLGWFWCGACDSQIVSQSQKCPVCGARENRSKIRLRPY